MNAPLVLIGAGGFGRETAELVRAVNGVRPSWELLGFLDDDPSMVGRRVGGLEVLGPSSWIEDRPEVRAVVCIGSPSTVGLRRRVVEGLRIEPQRYATLVHPSATIAESVSIGVGTVIHASTVCTADITIGAHVEIMPGVVLTHDDLVEDFVTLGAGARIAGNVRIERDAYVGAGASVREGLTIGRGSLLGMGAVLTPRSVPASEVWAGSPALQLERSGNEPDAS